MALNQTRTWLISYDISDPKRLLRVHRYLKTVAIPVQYSVFTTEANDHGICQIRDAIAQRIDLRQDDVRFYPLPKQLELHTYGRRSLPHGLQLLGDQAHRHSGLLASDSAAEPDAAASADQAHED